MQAEDAQDIIDRLSSLSINNANFQKGDLMSEKITPGAKEIICKLVDSIGSPTASAKLSAKSLSASPAESKQIEQALRQYEKSVCGQGWAHPSAPLPWQTSLERLIAHSQAIKILERQQKNEPLNASSGQASNGDKRLASCSATLAEIAELVDCEIETTPEDQLRAIRANLEQVLQSMPDELSDSLVQRETFTDEQIAKLKEIHSAFTNDYRTRRMMLIERVKVTLQAMLWSKDWLEKQGTLKQAEKDAEEGQSNLDINPGVEFEDVFIAKLEDIVAITSRSVHQEKDKFRATVKDVLIGDVPDRGGRPLEGRAAASQASMPAWAPRTSSELHTGPRGGGGGRGRFDAPRGRRGGGRRGR